jgi:hypothetical protein
MFQNTTPQIFWVYNGHHIVSINILKGNYISIIPSDLF